MRIGIDIDNVLCDSMPAFLRRINARYGLHLEVKDITAWNMDLPGTTLSKEIIESLKSEFFVRAFPPMEGACEAMRCLKRTTPHVVILLTHRGDETIVPTFGWVTRYFGAMPVHHTKDKSKHGCDVLIDDSPYNIEDFIEAGGKWAIVFDQPWNRKVETTKRIARCSDWSGVLETLSIIERLETKELSK